MLMNDNNNNNNKAPSLKINKNFVVCVFGSQRHFPFEELNYFDFSSSSSSSSSSSRDMILQYINALNASTKWRVILASKSPRRQEILKNLGIEFDVVSSTFEENFSKEGLKPEEYACKTAREKANEVFTRTKDEQQRGKGDKLIVISADTVVESVGGTILEKPRNIGDARAMMKRCRTVLTKYTREYA